MRGQLGQGRSRHRAETGGGAKGEGLPILDLRTRQCLFGRGDERPGRGLVGDIACQRHHFALAGGRPAIGALRDDLRQSAERTPDAEFGPQPRQGACGAVGRQGLAADRDVAPVDLGRDRARARRLAGDGHCGGDGPARHIPLDGLVEKQVPSAPEQCQRHQPPKPTSRLRHALTPKPLRPRPEASRLEHQRRRRADPEKGRDPGSGRSGDRSPRPNAATPPRRRLARPLSTGERPAAARSGTG